MWDRARSARRKMKTGLRGGKAILHFKRTSAHLTLLPSLEDTTATAPTGTVSMPARIVLNDVAKSGLLVFIPTFLVNGQAIEVKIPEPNALVIRGTITHCQQMFTDQRIISSQQFPFRASILFSVKTPEEQARIDTYFQNIQDTYLQAA